MTLKLTQESLFCEICTQRLSRKRLLTFWDQKANKTFCKGGGLQPKKNRKKTEKTEKKTVPNFKFAVAFGIFRIFSVFFGIFWFFSVFCGTFSVFFGLNFDKRFQSFKNHVNNEV